MEDLDWAFSVQNRFSEELKEKHREKEADMLAGTVPIKVARVRTQEMKHGMLNLTELCFPTSLQLPTWEELHFRCCPSSLEVSCRPLVQRQCFICVLK